MSTAAERESWSRLAAVGLFIGLPAMFAGLAALNFVEVGSDRLTLAEKQHQFAALTRRLNAKTADGKSVDLSAIYVAGASRSLASANLQQYVVDAISASSGRVLETAAIDPDAANDVGEANSLRLKTTLDTDNRGLLQLLYRLESGVPLLKVETLSIRRLPNPDSDAYSDKLRIDLAVRGQWRQPGT